MTPKRPLTDKELVLVAFLHDFFTVNHQLPQLQATCDGMKWASVSTAAKYLRQLEGKGYLAKNVVGNYKFTGGPAVLLR